MKIYHFLFGVFLLPCIASRILMHPHETLNHYGNHLMKQQQQLSARQNGFSQNIFNFLFQSAIGPIQEDLTRMREESHRMSLIVDAQKIIQDRQIKKLTEDLKNAQEAATKAQNTASIAVQRANMAMQELQTLENRIPINPSTGSNTITNTGGSNTGSNTGGSNTGGSNTGRTKT